MNNNLLRFIFGALCILGCLSIRANAQDYPMSLVIQSQQAQEVVPLRNINKITFDGNKMLLAITDKDQEVVKQSKSILLSEVEKCYFSNRFEPTGVTSTWIQPDNKYIAYALQNRLTILGLDAGQSYSVAIYAMDGTLLLERTAFRPDETIDISQYSNGIYLVHINNQTIKFVKNL